MTTRPWSDARCCAVDVGSGSSVSTAQHSTSVARLRTVQEIVVESPPRRIAAGGHPNQRLHQARSFAGIGYRGHMLSFLVAAALAAVPAAPEPGVSETLARARFSAIRDLRYDV